MCGLRMARPSPNPCRVYYILTRRRGAHTAHTQVGRPTHERTRHPLERTHTTTQQHKQTQVRVIPRAKALTPQPRHRRSRKPPPYEYRHVRRRAVEALRAVVLAHAEPREKTLLHLELLLSVELVVRLGQPLVIPHAAVEHTQVVLGPESCGARLTSRSNSACDAAAASASCFLALMSCLL